VKAPDLNRGRCIKIVNNLGDIQLVIKKFNEGIAKSFKNEKEEEDPFKNSIVYTSRTKQTKDDNEPVTLFQKFKQDGNINDYFKTRRDLK
jgi:hypothetical protein